MADQETEPLDATNADTPAPVAEDETERVFTECRRVGEVTISLQQLGFSSTAAWLLEVNGPAVAEGCDFQRMVVSEAGLLAIYELIGPIAEQLRAEAAARPKLELPEPMSAEQHEAWMEELRKTGRQPGTQAGGAE